jgi:hypothetical protein
LISIQLLLDIIIDRYPCRGTKTLKYKKVTNILKSLNTSKYYNSLKITVDYKLRNNKAKHDL